MNHRTRILAAVAVVTLLVTGCQRPIPGERPGPDDRPPRPTIGPTFAFQPQNRHFLIGVQLRNAEGVIMAGRIAIFADAVDSRGNRGTPAGGDSSFPIETTVGSGWQFPFDIPPDYEFDVNITMEATAIGLEPGERVECWIVEDTGLTYVYYHQRQATAPPINPHQPLDADCFAKVPGVPK
jgi:hypothetical protein